MSNAAQGDMPTPEAFRRALGQFATGIVVVTTRLSTGEGRGLTVNAFTSVSLDPPLVLYCLGRSAYHFSVFEKAEAFAINFLGAGQQALSDRFARETDDGLDGLETLGLVTGSPILSSCETALDCRREAIHDAGDHVVVVGRVAAIHRPDRPAGAEDDPLIYFGSTYRRLRP